MHSQVSLTQRMRSQQGPLTGEDTQTLPSWSDPCLRQFIPQHRSRAPTSVEPLSHSPGFGSCLRPLTGCVTVDKLLNPSEPQLLFL